MTEYESILISRYKDEMINYLHNHSEAFDEAFSLAVSNNQPFAWRSAWLLWSCLKNNDSRITNHIDEILDNIDGKGDGHQRELIKILEKLELNKEQEGKLLNLCIQLWENISKKPSIRYTAFRNILKIAKKYPELASEIDFFTQSPFLVTLSPGVKHSLKKMIKDFKESLDIH